MPRASNAGRGALHPRRLLLIAAILAAIYFAVQGGEYSTTALFRQKQREDSLKGAIADLTRQVDSLRARRRAIERDPATQERIGREEHGLVRGDKEILYRFVDSASKP